MIWDDRLWDPKMYPHSLKEEFSSSFFCDILLAGCRNGRLREFVDDHKITVVSMLSRRKARHVIHGDGFPRPTRFGQRNIEALFLDGRFWNGTGSERFDVLPDILSKIRPIEILLQYCYCFLDPEMLSSSIVVCFQNYLGIIAWRNTKVTQVA